MSDWRRRYLNRNTNLLSEEDDEDGKISAEREESNDIRRSTGNWRDNYFAYKDGKYDPGNVTALEDDEGTEGGEETELDIDPEKPGLFERAKGFVDKLRGRPDDKEVYLPSNEDLGLSDQEVERILESMPDEIPEDVTDEMRVQLYMRAAELKRDAQKRLDELKLDLDDLKGGVDGDVRQPSKGVGIMLSGSAMSASKKQGKGIKLQKDIEELEAQIELANEIMGVSEVNRDWWKNVWGQIKSQEYIPVLGSAMTAGEVASLVRVQKKVEQGEELSDGEKDLLRKYNAMDLNSYLDRGFAYDVTGSVVPSLSIMGEFAIAAMSGGATAPALATKVGGKEMLKKGAKSLVKSAVLTATVRSPQVAIKTIENSSPEYIYVYENAGTTLEKLNDGESRGKAFVRALTDTYVETLIEAGVGGAIDDVAKGVGKRAVNNKLVREYAQRAVESSLILAYAQKTGTKVTDVLGKRIAQIGWDGVLGEISEEVLQGYATAYINDEDYELTADEFKTIVGSVMLTGTLVGGTANLLGGDKRSDEAPVTPKTEVVVDEEVVEPIQPADDEVAPEEKAVDTRDTLRTDLEKAKEEGGLSDDDIVASVGSGSLSDLIPDKTLVSQVSNGEIKTVGEILTVLKEKNMYNQLVTNLEIGDQVKEILASDEKFVDFVGLERSDYETDLEATEVVTDLLVREKMREAVTASSKPQAKEREAVATRANGFNAEQKKELGSIVQAIQTTLDTPPGKTVTATSDGDYVIAKDGAPYPAFIPEGYRTKRIAQAVVDAFVNETVPKNGTKAFELYNMLLDQVETAEITPATPKKAQPKAKKEVKPSEAVEQAKKKKGASNTSKGLDNVAKMVDGEIVYPDSRMDWGSTEPFEGLTVDDVITDYINGHAYPSLTGFEYWLETNPRLQVDTMENMLKKATAYEEIAEGEKAREGAERQTESVEGEKKKVGNEQDEIKELVGDILGKDVVGFNDEVANYVGRSAPDFASMDDAELEEQMLELSALPASIGEYNPDNLRLAVLAQIELEKRDVKAGRPKRSDCVGEICKLLKRGTTITPHRAMIADSMETAINKYKKMRTSRIGRTKLLRGFEHIDTKGGVQSLNEGVENKVYDGNILDNLSRQGARFYTEREILEGIEAEGLDQRADEAIEEVARLHEKNNSRIASDLRTNKEQLRKIVLDIYKENRRMFGDNLISVVDKIAHPEANRALGLYHNKWITVLRGQADPMSTFQHEAVHKAKDLLPEKKQKELIDAVIEKYGEEELRKRWGDTAMLLKYRIGANDKGKIPTLYHGTSLDFPMFDTKYIASAYQSSGENAQAYGWGLYFTMDKGTGRHYAETSYNNYVKENWSDLGAQTDADEKIYDSIKNNGGIKISPAMILKEEALKKAKGYAKTVFYNENGDRWLMSKVGAMNLELLIGSGGSIADVTPEWLEKRRLFVRDGDIEYLGRVIKKRDLENNREYADLLNLWVGDYQKGFIFDNMSGELRDAFDDLVLTKTFLNGVKNIQEFIADQSYTDRLSNGETVTQIVDSANEYVDKILSDPKSITSAAFEDRVSDQYNLLHMVASELVFAIKDADMGTTDYDEYLKFSERKIFRLETPLILAQDNLTALFTPAFDELVLRNEGKELEKRLLEFMQANRNDLVTKQGVIPMGAQDVMNKYLKGLEEKEKTVHRKRLITASAQEKYNKQHLWDWHDDSDYADNPFKQRVHEALEKLLPANEREQISAWAIKGGGDFEKIISAFEQKVTPEKFLDNLSDFAEEVENLMYGLEGNHMDNASLANGDFYEDLRQLFSVHLNFALQIDRLKDPSGKQLAEELKKLNLNSLADFVLRATEKRKSDGTPRWMTIGRQGEALETAVPRLNDKKFASMFLLDYAGYIGHEFEGWLAKKKGVDVYNYVIYDDQTINIDENIYWRNNPQAVATIEDMAEEQLAEDFIAYMRHPDTVIGKLRRLFDEFMHYIKSIVDRADVINDFYRSLNRGDFADVSYLATSGGVLSNAERFRNKLADKFYTTRAEMVEYVESMGLPSLKGIKSIKSMRDLHDKLDSYRGLNFEVMHAIAANKRGRVIEHLAVTNMRTDSVDVEQYKTNILELNDREDIDSIYIVHNHPSLNSIPSDADIRATNYFMLNMHKLKAHIVTDTKNTSVMDRNYWNRDPEFEFFDLLKFGDYTERFTRQRGKFHVNGLASMKTFVEQEVAGNLPRGKFALVPLYGNMTTSPEMVLHLSEQEYLYDPKGRDKLIQVFDSLGFTDLYSRFVIVSRFNNPDRPFQTPAQMVGALDGRLIDVFKVTDKGSVKWANYTIPQAYEYQNMGVTTRLHDSALDGYDRTTPQVKDVDMISPVGLPELIDLQDKLLKKDVKITNRMRRALGKFVSFGTDGSIELNSILFKPVKEKALELSGGKLKQVELPEEETVRKARMAMLNKVLAHEIGHAVDWMDKKTLKRGNILGRIASLNRFAKAVYGDLNNKEIREELKELTMLWNPWERGRNEKYDKYRDSSKELYAEAISVLLNDVELLKRVAPNFYQGFMDYISRKPEAEKVLFEVWDRMIEGREAVNLARLDKLAEAQERARKRREEIDIKESPNIGDAFTRIRNGLRRGFVSQFAPIYEVIEKNAKSKGIRMSEKQKVRSTLESLAYLENDLHTYMLDIEPIIADMLSAGITETELGQVLVLTRNLGDRLEKANPHGLMYEYAQESLDELMDGMSKEKREALESGLKRFRDLNFDIVERGYEAGLFTTTFMKEVAEVNKNTYVPFAVIDYIERNHVTSSIISVKGTLKSVENPLITQVLKSMSILRAASRNEAKRTVVNSIQELSPEDIMLASVVRGKDGRFVKFKEHPDLATMPMFIDGVFGGYYVDPAIASMFDETRNSAEIRDAHDIIKVFDMFNSVFKPLVTSWNLSWGLYANPVRDFTRMSRNIYALLSEEGKLSPGEKLTGGVVLDVKLVKAWLKSVKEAYGFTKGEYTDTTREMLENKVLALPHRFDELTHSPEASVLDPARRKAKLLQYVKKHNPGKVELLAGKIAKLPLIKQGVWALEKYTQIAEAIGNVFEVNSKISGYRLMKERIEEVEKVADYTRNYVGTPNYREGGSLTKFSNRLFVFSNIAIQAVRSDTRLLNNPKTRYAYLLKMFIQAGLWKLLMVAMQAGLMGDDEKEQMLRMTEYDKTNYNIIPLGWHEGKAVYMRVPQDESNRLFGALIWKMGTALTGDLQKPEQIASLSAGFLPFGNVPLLEISSSWLQWAQGRNPYDDFRGRPAIAQSLWDQGGMVRFTEMLKYTTNMGGLTHFSTYDDSSKTTLEAVLDAPVLERAFRVTDYGLQEAESEKSKDADMQKAREKAERKALKEDLVDQYIYEGADLDDLVDHYVRESLGDDPSKSDVTRLRKDLKAGIYEWLDESTYSRLTRYGISNEEKLWVYTERKKSLARTDYIEMLEYQREFEVLSDPMLKLLLENKLVTEREYKKLLDINP